MAFNCLLNVCVLVQIKAVNSFTLHCTKLQRWNVFLFLLAPEFQDLFWELLFSVLGAKIWENFWVPLTTLVTVAMTKCTCSALL